MCKGMYNLEGLTAEEENLLKSPERVIQVLLGPLAYLVKKDIKREVQDKDYAALIDKPVISQLVDNSNLLSIHHDVKMKQPVENEKRNFEILGKKFMHEIKIDAKK